ncbi:MAG: response regulator transcription factor [Pseudomonadota bacterium]
MKTHPPVVRLRVVIVDDNEMTRSVLRMMLQENDCDVIGEGTSGKSGLEVILKTRPQLVFLDIMLPDCSGLELLESIKNALPSTTIVMVTASNDAETIRTALAGGASGFILKPFSSKTVHDSIVKAVAGDRKPIAQP